jgi:hypothetical protein
MGTKRKTWKIGEYAIGGIIIVNIHGKVILIEAREWNSKEVVSSGSVLSTDSDARRKIDNFLNDLTTSYYADKILNWISENSQVGETYW